MSRKSKKRNRSQVRKFFEQNPTVTYTFDTVLDAWVAVVINNNNIVDTVDGESLKETYENVMESVEVLGLATGLQHLLDRDNLSEEQQVEASVFFADVL